MPEPNDPAELEKLGNLLKDPQKRKDFFIDAEGAMHRADIDTDRIPDALVSALKDLDYGELSALSRVNQSLIDYGFSGDDPLMWPV